MNPSDFRVVYAGTPDFAVPALEALINAGYTVPAVYTQPDRRAGRGRKIQMSPVKALAVAHNLVVEQPSGLRDEKQHQILKDHRPDLMVVAAYGQILPQEILDIPVHGCINIHASLLPRWRGAAPIQRAIEHGDVKTGVTIMQMDLGLDTGDMLHKAECEIGVSTTSAQLHDTLAALGADALQHTLELLHENTLVPQKQDESASCYAAKIEKAEAVIDWQRPAVELHRKVCAFNSWPVAQTSLASEVIRIWETTVVNEASGFDPGQIVSTDNALDVATTDGILRIHKLQPPGKKAMSAGDFLNSRQLKAGTQLG